MEIYILNYITLALWYLFIGNNRKFITVACLQMWIILALRSENMGVDVGAYSQYFQSYSQYDFIEMVMGTNIIGYHSLAWGLESGYVWLNWICAQFHCSFHDFLVVHAAICMIGIRKFLLKYEKDAFYMLLYIIGFGVWGSFFCILRQSLALIVLLQSIDYVKERNVVKFLGVVFIATLFHKAALCFLPVYWMYSLRFTNKNILLVSMFGLVWFYVISYLHSLFSIFLDVLGKSDLYTVSDFQANNMILCFVTMFLIIICLFREKKLNGDKDSRLSIWCFVLTLYIQEIAFFQPTFARVAIELTFPFATIALAELIINQRNARVRALLGVLCYVGVFVFYLFTSLSRSPIVPYVPM